MGSKNKGLNPFEVREVLQGLVAMGCVLVDSLNPFEVREVLQVLGNRRQHRVHVSIPLKSGRCCKGALQNYLFKIKELFVKLR